MVQTIKISNAEMNLINDLLNLTYTYKASY